METQQIPREYKKAYDRGWRYSSTSGNATLDHLDSKGASEAEYDGYLDAGAGREKYHSFHCRQAGGCDEHQWEVKR